MLKFFGFSNGLPNAMSRSRSASSAAAFSRSSFSRFSARSRLIFSSSRCSSASSSSSSSLSSSLSSSSSSSTESASISRDSSNMRRRFASGSSSSPPPPLSDCDVNSRGRFAALLVIEVVSVASPVAAGSAPPFCFAKWAASAARSSARRSRASSASPPWPGFRNLS